MGDSIAFAPQGLDTNYAGALQAANQATISGVQANQVQATRNAFAGFDPDDPASNNSVLGKLIQAGALDQAKAATDLAFTRRAIPGANATIDAFNRQATAPGGPFGDSGAPATTAAPEPPIPTAQPGAAAPAPGQA